MNKLTINNKNYTYNNMDKTKRVIELPKKLKITKLKILIIIE
jgi:hypothetical protein